MSETRLKNNSHLLSYVRIPGYTNLFRNGDNSRGGGGGVYIRETIDSKRRTDFENIELELIENSGKNKHSKLLLGVMDHIVPPACKNFRFGLRRLKTY